MILNLDKPQINWDIDKKIIMREDVLPHDVCDELVKFGDANATVGVNKYPGLFGIRFHACLLPLNHEVHNLLQDTWKEVSDLFSIDIDFVEPYEFKRYASSDFFGKHVDNYYSLTTPVDRKITMSIQLSHTVDYDGGELTIINKKFKAPKGSVICFPSFFPHTVEKITSGTRKSLIGWAWGPYWK